MSTRAAAVVLGCALIFGPERFPLGGGVHTEIRVQFCAHAWGGAHLVVGTRTYERTQNRDGTYTETPLSTDGEGGWRETRVNLHVTTREPPP